MIENVKKAGYAYKYFLRRDGRSSTNHHVVFHIDGGGIIQADFKGFADEMGRHP